MAYKRGRWPNYALWALEDVKARLAQIEADARAVQLAAKDGNALQAIILAGDIRTAAMDAKNQLTKAKEGDYDNG